MAEQKKYRIKGEPISLDEMKQFLWGAATRLRGQIDAALMVLIGVTCVR